MRRIIILILFTLIAGSTNAQWQQVYTVPNWVYSFTATGNNIFIGAGSTGIHSSANNGANWSQGNLTGTVYSLASSGSFLFAGNSGNGIFRSSNAGVNWIQTPLNNRFIRTLAVNGATILAGTSSSDNEIYLSTNYGANWNEVSPIGGEVMSLNISDNYVFAGGNPVGVFISTNDGANWQQSSLNSGIVRAIVSNGSNIYAGTNSGVFISTNYGANWVESSLSTQYIYSMALNGSNLYAANGTGGVWVSNNSGVNWTQRNEGFGGLNVQNVFISGSYIYASAYTGSNHTVFRRPLSELVGIQNISSEIPDGFSLQQNYPNPFNPSTKIKFAIPNSSFVKLAVYDMLGREVSSLVNEQLQPGTYEYEFEASGLISGVYFYKISTDNFSEVRKMILIK